MIRSALAGTAILIVFCSACSDLRDIDAKTDQLLRDRVAKVGGGAISPERSFANPVDPPRDPALTRKEPPTVNPGRDELRFDAAAESRDVAQRLNEFQTEASPDARHMGLDDVFRQAQITAREHLSAEEAYIIAAIQLLIEQHRFNPQLFGDIATTYSETHVDGGRDLTLRVLGQLGVRQQLPFGGEVGARWIWEATEDLRHSATDRYVQASSLIVSGQVPLLRGFGDVAQESLIQSERSLVYAARDFESFRREFLVALASDFFQLLQFQDSIESQLRQLESLQRLEERQRAWYEAGRIREFEVNLAINNVLAARASLANLRESYILALDRFKVRLGIAVREPVVIINSDLFLPEPETTLEQATEAALAFRLDLQNQRDQVEDVRRQIQVAANALLPDLNLTGSVRFPTDPNAREGGVVYAFDDVEYVAAATFGLPLDRRVERLTLRRRTIEAAQAQRSYDRFRDELILDVRGRTREVERARLNLELAEERVKINLRRKEEQELKPDEVSTQEQVDTANDIRNAEQARDQSKADLRNAVLQYLLATGQMRVKRDGTFDPLPGMRMPQPTPPAPQPTPPGQP